MTTKRIQPSEIKNRSTCLGFTLGCAIFAAFMFLPSSVPVLADAQQLQQQNETPGLIHGVTPPPQKVDVNSLEPAPPFDETLPPRPVRPHVRNPEELQLQKQLLEEGFIKPQTDVIEDTGNPHSSETEKEKKP